jgi:drug/metabolite transporter (DMT)-like permease
VTHPAAPLSENATLGAAVMVVTACTMAFGDALVKSISTDFTLSQIYVLRSLVAIPILIILLLLGRPHGAIRPKSVRWTLLRSLLLMMMWLTFYAALPVLSLPVVAAAYYTGPLFISLLSALLTGEEVGSRRWLAIFAGFLGVLVILRPGTDAFSWLTLLPVAAAMFYALAAIVTRTRCIDENPLTLSLALNMSFLMVGLIGAGVLTLWDPTASHASAYPFLLGPWTTIGQREWAIIVLLAVLIVAISAGVAKAYQSGPPAVIATLDYTYLVFAALWSFVFFSETPDVATAAGMLLIAGAGIVAVWRPQTMRRVRASPVGL